MVRLLKHIKFRYAKTNLNRSQKKRGLKNFLKHSKIIDDKCIVLCLVDGSGIGATDSYQLEFTSFVLLFCIRLF
jgi:hypothetical protein